MRASTARQTWAGSFHSHFGCSRSRSPLILNLSYWRVTCCSLRRPSVQKENTLMSQVAIKKVNDAGKTSLPIFGELAKQFDAVRQRAFALFENRGRELG